jgi:hypothetical protein
MKNKIYKGILIGAIGYPIFQEFLGVLGSLSQLVQNKLDLGSAKLAKEAQDLVVPATEQETQCIGFQYNPPEEEECLEEGKK